MKNYLAISALGKNQPGLIEALSRAILECDCNIEKSHMMPLGSEFAITMTIQGNWNTLARLETQLKRLEQSLNMTVVAKRTEDPQHRDNGLPYNVEVVSIKHPAIIHSLAEFFASRSVSIEELATHVYTASHTHTPMLSATLVISIPTDTYIAMFREEFMDFCDELNLDAMMEPIK